MSHKWYFVPLEDVPMAKTSCGIDVFLLVIASLYNYREDI
jgi:hypothetical protein